MYYRLRGRHFIELTKEEIDRLLIGENICFRDDNGEGGECEMEIVADIMEKPTKGTTQTYYMDLCEQEINRILEEDRHRSEQLIKRLRQSIEKLREIIG